MASKLKQLQSKATLASEFLSKHGTTYYKQLLEQNKQYIQEPATVEKCNELSKQLFYTRLARLNICFYDNCYFTFWFMIVGKNSFQNSFHFY
ncbi:putative ATP synthase, F0 complex, subunit G [Helianthus annuus]|nr:putative ATP synthase, F0 complex, subunit G [Helianthus annuus]